MKTLLLSFLLTSSLAAFGQGTVNFNNRVTAAGLFAPIYGLGPSYQWIRISGNATTNGGSADYTGFPLLSGDGFTASLWTAAPGTGTADLGAFERIGAYVTFNTSTSLGGIFRSGGATITPWAPGQAASFQVRAWDNYGGTITTWADALAANQRGQVGAGYSDVFTINVGEGDFPGTSLVGLTSFSFVIPGGNIPEPTTLALALLIAGGFLSRRLLS